MTKLNDKQLAALEALINEQAPSGEALRAALIKGWCSMALAHYETDSQPTPVAIPYNYALPTLEAINTRVLRDLVKWEYNENALTFKAILGPWHLCVWRNCPEGHHFASASIRTERVSSHVSKAIQGNSYASADEAKAACMKLITDVRNELLSKLREDGMQP